MSDGIPSVDQAAPSTSLVITPRSNPRHLFVKAQLPSTEASSSVTPSPTSASTAAPQASGDPQGDPSSSKQPQASTDAHEDKHAGQGTSRDAQHHDMREEDDPEHLTESQVMLAALVPFWRQHHLRCSADNENDVPLLPVFPCAACFADSGCIAFPR